MVALGRRALWLAVALCTSSAWGFDGAKAQSTAETYRVAVSSMDKLVDEAKPAGNRPRMSDPRVAAAVAILSDQDRKLGTDAFPIVMETMDICGQATRLGMGYATHGIEAAFSRPPQPADTAAVVQLVNKNFAEFQEEIVPLLRFARQCVSLSTRPMEKFVQSLPTEQMTDIRRGGLAKMRNGAVGMFAGSIQTLAQPGLREGLRELIFEGVERDLANIAPALTLADRSALSAILSDLRSTLPMSRHAVIDSMMKTLDDKSCEGICKY
jgi:hypothetical protein